MYLISPQKYPLLRNGLIYFDSAALFPLHEDVIKKTVSAMEITAAVAASTAASSIASEATISNFPGCFLTSAFSSAISLDNWSN